MAINIQKDIDKLIDLYFNQPLILYEHLFASYNQFIEEIIPYCLKQEQNYFYENIDGHLVHFHGFKCDNIRIKPATFDNDNEIKFPNEARKNHLNYFASIIVDIKQYIETNNILTGEKTVKEVYSENNISIGNVPIMIKSKYCSTYIKKDSHGECRFDPGGYFLVNGQEKVIMSIEKMADNKIFIFTKKDSSFENGLIYLAHINSRKNDWSDSLQIAYIKTRKDGVLSLTSSQLVDIPIFIIFRALGLETDQDIISKICYSLDDVKMLNLIRPSMIFSQDEEGNQIKTKEEAINYLINKLSKTRRISQTDEAMATKQKIIILQKILRKDLLLHLGEDIPKKIMFIGLMVNKLLQVMLGRADPDDRDFLQNKRIETPGILLGQLFRQNWRKMLSEIGKLFRKKNQFDLNPINVISQIKSTTIEQGIKTALATGVWGMNRSRNGVAQALQRLSWIQSQSYFRRVLTTTLDSSTSAVVSIRLVENNQYKFLCVTGDTEILLSNKMETKLIKDITNNDWVTSINNETLIDEPTNIHSYFSKIPDKLFEITTESGRTIKATAEHPFLVNNDGIYKWINLENLNKNDKIIIRHSLKYIKDESDCQTKVIITENELLLSHYNLELISTGLINKYIDVNKLKIIARLIGAIHTCGFVRILNVNNKENLTCSFHLNEECDVIQLLDDIRYLGFGTATVSRNVMPPNKNKTRKINSSKTWCVMKNGAFPYFMNRIAETKGDIKQIPDWLLNSELSIKREFLSAFQGGDGSKILFQKDKDHWYPSIGKTFYTTYNKNVLETTKYMKNISQMFKDFNIENSICDVRVDQLTTKVCIIFDKSTESLSNYADNIGYTYHDEKRRLSSVVIEQIKIIEFNRLNGNLNIDITDSIYDSYLDSIALHNGCVSVKINLIKEIPVEPVYDFTTFSDNHSFVASSFVTHNCPIETPEGAKIGIVKSVAMMSSITTQNNAQEKVITTILNDNKKIKHPADINPLEMNLHVKIFMNGNWVGVIKITHAIKVYQDLKEKRKENIIDKYTTMLFDYDKKEIRIYFDGGRLIRPLLIVNNNELNIDENVIKVINEEQGRIEINKGWNNLLNKYQNIIEYEDIETCNYHMIAERTEKLAEAKNNSNNIIEYKEGSKVNRYGDYRYVNFTHCEFHGWVMLGTTAANVPFINHDYATKSIVNFSQVKQTIGIYLTSYKDRMDISQILYHPQVPIAQTKAMKYNNFLDMPYGENVIVALMCYTGYNQEDSLVFNQSAIDRGIFRSDTLAIKHSEVAKNPSTSQDDIFTKPDANKVTGMKQGNYSKLNDRGFVPEETEIFNNDIIIGKVSPIQPTGNNNKVYKDSSEQFKSNVDGVIDRVHTGIYNAEGYEIYNVRVRMERKPIIGDKFCLINCDVLTNKGWTKIEYVTKDHLVAILNPDKDTIEYENPLEIHCFDYDSEVDGKIYQLKSQLVDLTVTPNHRMVVKKRKTLEDGKFNYSDKFDFMLAKDCFGKRLKYKKSVANFEPSNWIGDTFTIPEYKDRLEIKVNMKDWLVFFGIWIAEGWIDKTCVRITISANKLRVQKALDKIIKNMGLHIIKSKDCKWHIYCIQLVTLMESLSVGAINKYLPDWVWQLNKDQSQLLIDSMMLGDGHLSKSNTNLYYTSSENLANDLSRLCLHAGWSANQRKINGKEMGSETFNNKNGNVVKSNADALCVTIIKTKLEPEINHGHSKTQNGQSEEWIDYKGTVHCLTVSSGIFMIRQNGKPVWTGNSNRHGQKGTLGIALPQKDMPFTEEGMIPDIIMNVHSIPSRMTMGQLVESLASKEAAINGHFVDGTPFSDYDIKEIPAILGKLGYSPHGTEIMYNGMTGKKMEVEIFIGPTYQVRLKHMVQDKVHGRANGPRQALTRQPLEGRSRDGGLKIGEMEKDAIVAHGMGQFLKERMMETSDITKIYVCDDCGLFAAKVIDKDYYTCKACHNSTRISAVVIPYACKLLFQELMAVNILPRIRTETSVYNYDA